MIARRAAPYRYLALAGEVLRREDARESRLYV